MVPPGDPRPEYPPVSRRGGDLAPVVAAEQASRLLKNRSRSACQPASWKLKEHLDAVVFHREGQREPRRSFTAEVPQHWPGPR